jgi:hypothetical protein
MKQPTNDLRDELWELLIPISGIRIDNPILDEILALVRSKMPKEKDVILPNNPTQEEIAEWNTKQGWNAYRKAAINILGGEDVK